VQRKYEYRRNLPHYQKDNRILFITYSTWHRWRLPDIAMDLALESCRRADGRKYSLYTAVVMPDHVHLICMPLIDENGSISIPEITRTIKSESAHRINHALGRTGRVWQDESFDHISAAMRVSGRRCCTFWRIPFGLDWRLVPESIDGCGGTNS
jgi:putative transposase